MDNEIRQRMANWVNELYFNEGGAYDKQNA